MGQADFEEVIVHYNFKDQKLQDYWINATTASEKDDNGSGYVRNMILQMHFARYWFPFVMKYYLPCGCIVILAHISYFIPPNAVPGRISLLLTNFLVLSNIFSSHQVS